MNKYIFLALLFALLATQTDAQIIKIVIKACFSIVGFTFKFVIRITQSVFKITFRPNTAMKSEVSVKIKAANPTAATAMEAIDAINLKIEDTYATWQAAIPTVNIKTRFRGAYNARNGRKAVKDVSYGLSAIVNVFLGYKPSGWTLDFAGFSGLVDVGASTSGVTVGVQAKAAEYWIDYLINMLNTTIMEAWDLQKHCPENFTISIPDGTEIIGMLNTLKTAVQGAKTDVTVKSLMDFLSSSSADFGAIFTKVQAFVEGYIKMTQDMMVCMGNENYKVKSASGARRFRKKFGSHHKRSRKNRKGYNLDAMASFKGIWDEMYGSFQGIIDDYEAKYGLITRTSVKSSVNDHKNVFNNFLINVKFNFQTIMGQLNVGFGSLETQKEDLTIKAFTDVVGQVDALINDIITANIECNITTEAIVEGAVTFINDIEACASSGDTGTETSTTTASISFTDLINMIQGYMNTSDACFQTACANNLIQKIADLGPACVNDGTFGVIITGPIKVNNLKNCLANIQATINANSGTIMSGIQAIMQAFNASTSSTLSAMNTCITGKVNAMIAQLTTSASAFATCKAAVAAPSPAS